MQSELSLAIYFFLLYYLSEMNLLTTKEASEKLGISAIRVRQLIQSGRLPAQKLGRDHLINESDLQLVKVRTNGRPKKETKD
jgi:excisionase family DNA binding protein